MAVVAVVKLVILLRQIIMVSLVDQAVVDQLQDLEMAALHLLPVKETQEPVEQAVVETGAVVVVEQEAVDHLKMVEQEPVVLALVTIP